METVGVYLKKERESRNISLSEASRLTKISEFYLDYIEKDDFDKLPQGPYIKGYISCYSRLIGGNEDEALKLYDLLNGKRTQDEDTPPDPPGDTGWKAAIGASLNSIVSALDKTKNGGRNHPPERPEATSSRLLPVVSALKKAGASIKAIGPSIQKKSVFLKTIIPFFKKTATSVSANLRFSHQRIWLTGCIFLLGAAILVFAGFGFYHLFIYDGHPPTAAEQQVLQDREEPFPPAIGAEKKLLPPRSKDSSATSRPREERTVKREGLPLVSLSADQKRPPSLSTNPDGDRVRAGSTAEKADSNFAPDSQPDALPPDSSVQQGNSALGRTGAGKGKNVSSDGIGMAARPSSGPATAAVNLSVLSASVCSGIENRMPAGVDTSFPSSVQRVYVWNRIEAREIPSKIRHIYYFKGRKISDVTLDVRSPYWRTWSYKSISDNRYQGEWRVDIASNGGEVLRRLYFEIK